MATVFKDTEAPHIPYPGLADALFSSTQKLIPFVGAGASLDPHGAPAARYPEQATVDRITIELGLSGDAKSFLERSIRNACELQAYELAGEGAFEVVAKKPYPPSALELAEALAAKAEYTCAEWPLPLLSVSSYHEFVLQRTGLWSALHDIFSSKCNPTPTDELIARTARWYLGHAEASADYLVITTNYDRLIELAFNSAGVPYCVLTVDKNDRYVDAAFSPNMQRWQKLTDDDYREFVRQCQEQKFPSAYMLPTKRRPIAIVFKIHGCLFPLREGRDSVVLSDEDYIEYLNRLSDNAGMLPAIVKTTMQSRTPRDSKGFLFAGYSFSDWNVRSIYRAVLEGRARGQSTVDYAVLLKVSPYESAFFRESTIHLLETDLSAFVEKLRHTQKAAAAWDWELPQ